MGSCRLPLSRSSFRLTPTGLELQSATPDGKSILGNQPAGRAAKSGADSAGSPPDNDLAHVVAAWPALPEAIRRAVLALVGTASATWPADAGKT
jgi:hypothetical protein